MKKMIGMLLFFIVLTAGCFDAEGADNDLNTEAKLVTEATSDAEAETAAKSNTDTTENEQVVDETNNQADESSLHSLEIAQRDMDQFLNVLREGNTEALVSLARESRYDDEQWAAIVIKAFAHNFDLETLTAESTYRGHAMSSEYGQYEFRLTDLPDNDNDHENFIRISYDQEGNKRFVHPYISYFPQAEKMVVRYLELIKQEDAETLASFINPDDLEVPVWVAEETIRRYKEAFSNPNLTLTYLKRFDFSVADDLAHTHEIQVFYGDGLMSILDNWIPEFHDPLIRSMPLDVIQKLKEEHGDRFAGAYLESDSYHINLMEGTDPLTLGIDPDSFIVHEVAFSYDELTMLYEEVLALDAEEKIRLGVQSISLDERDNRVIIALRPDHGHMATEVIALFDHPAIEVVVGEGTIQITE